MTRPALPLTSLPLIALLLLTVMLASACDVVGVRGSGTLATETRTIDEFEHVRISRALHAEIEVVEGAEPALEITIDDNIMVEVVTEVRNGTLVIEAARNIRPSSDHIIRITTGALTGVTASGATRVELRGQPVTDAFTLAVSGASRVTIESPLQGDLVDADVSGASTVNLREVETDALVVAASGASSLDASGTAGSLEVAVSGASTARVQEVEAAEAHVEISGASRAHVRASDRISGSATGASTLHVYGNPALGDFETSGASSIRTEE